MCGKRKFDRIKAMLVIANSQKRTQQSFNRKEKRIYYCSICNGYHTTSKLK